jgi:F-type H+-transporting ATPase subunit gamma
VRNIKKITRTMQLIATARFQAAMNRAVASRPYTDKLAEMVADLSGVAGEVRHPLMEVHGGKDRSALVVVTSNRGLCGGYNAAVLRAALEHIAAHEQAQAAVEAHVVGKKGIAAFRFRGREMAARITDIDDRPRYEQVEPLARSLTQGFLEGRYGAVHVAYMRFYSVGRQRPEVIRLLPLAQAPTGAGAAAGERAAQYEILPSAEELLERLLPAVVRMRLYQSFLDAAVSEQIARMAAMKAATEAAEEMIGSLTREYNRARQSQITLELLDIVGGANALA